VRRAVGACSRVQPFLAEIEPAQIGLRGHDQRVAYELVDQRVDVARGPTPLPLPPLQQDEQRVALLGDDVERSFAPVVERLRDAGSEVVTFPHHVVVYVARRG